VRDGRRHEIHRPLIAILATLAIAGPAAAKGPRTAYFRVIKPLGVLSLRGSPQSCFGCTVDVRKTWSGAAPRGYR
jgi:hypothetical protein